jgi:hypothetical protein
MKILWRKKPEKQDYPAAESYLSLLFSRNEVLRLIQKLKDSYVVFFEAKDIFRASGLSLLGVSNSHVKADQDKIKAGKELSPLLLMRYKGRVIIADGYHRLCAVYSFDEDAEIPCKIV